MPITIFSIYVLAQVVFASDPYQSLRISSKVIISILMFPVGFYLIKDIEQLKKLNKSVVLVMLILVVNYIICQKYGLGTSGYTGGKEFLTGNLADSWNTYTYVLFLVPLIIKSTDSKNLKIITLLFSLFLLILLIIGLKRTAIIGLLVGYFIYLIGSEKSFKVLTIYALVSVSVFLFLHNWGSVFFERVEARGNRLGTNIREIVETEARYHETFYVWKETFSFNDPFKSIFGLEAFNSVRNYANGMFGRRSVHIDYNLIVNTIGLVGFLLYLNIFWGIFKLFLRIGQKIPDKDIYREMKNIFLVLLIVPFFTSIGGQMYAITFRSIIFLYLGSILGVFYNYKRHKVYFPTRQIIRFCKTNM